MESWGQTPTQTRFVKGCGLVSPFALQPAPTQILFAESMVPKLWLSDDLEGQEEINEKLPTRKNQRGFALKI